jgi:hypothetical protein
MPYYKLQNTCDVYKESGTAITNNQKYINPFLPNSQKVAFYNENIFDKNSYQYNNNNLYPSTKSYNSITEGYKHYINSLIDAKEELLNQEKEILKEAKTDLENISKNIKNN